jgi:hypothetical protein
VFGVGECCLGLWIFNSFLRLFRGTYFFILAMGTITIPSDDVLLLTNPGVAYYSFQFNRFLTVNS